MFPHQQVDRISLQCQFQEDSIIGQKIKTVARHLRAGFEVEKLEAAAKLNVVERLEVEVGDGGPSQADLNGGVLASYRCGGMREVGDRPKDLVRFLNDLGQLPLEGRDLFAKPPSFALAGLAFGGVGRRGDRLAHLPSLLVEPVDVGLHLPP